MQDSSKRDLDGIELTILFFFRNWLLLAILTIAGAAAGLALSQGRTATYTTSFSIAAPAYVVPAFDQLMLSVEGNSFSDRLSFTTTNLSPTEVTQAANAVLAAAQTAADEAIAREVNRLEYLVATRSELISKEGDPTVNDVELATALVANQQGIDTTEHRISTLKRWESDFPAALAITEVAPRRLVFFGGFSGFTLAVLIALARLMYERRKAIVES